MEGTKLRESRKGNNRRRGGRKDEKRELRRMKSEEISPWPQFAVAGIENTIMEQETLDLENYDNGKPRMFCFSSPFIFIRVN